jgi:predicted nucleic acid-binding Zn ribbon protein
MISLLPLIASLVAGENDQNHGNQGLSGQHYPICQLRAPLVFSPDSLNFKDSDGAQTFSVSLANAPIGPVIYYLDGKNMRFDKCFVSFDENNWNIPQVIQTIPTLYKGNDATLNFDIVATGKDGKRVKGRIPVTRHAMDAPVGASAGDPHFTLFTGGIITQQKHVVNYLFKSPEFDVMTGQEHCSPKSKKIFCNHAVVVRFGDDWYTYDSRAVTKDGSGIVVTYNGPENSAFIYTPPTNGKKTHEFLIPDGSKVSVYPSAFSEKYGVHNTVKLSLHPSMAMKGSGALNAPYAEGDKLIYANGTTGNAKVAAQAQAFLASWAVPDSSNYLMGKNIVKTPSTMPVFEKCTHKKAKKAKKAKKLPKYQGTWVNVDEKDVGSSLYTNAQLKTADKVCASVFKDIKFCQNIISSKPFEEVCKLDVLLDDDNNDIAIAQDHLEDYLLECAENVNSLADVDAKIDKVMQKFGFGTIACPKNCSGNGECTEAGCMCNPGFHGVNCADAN